MKKTLLVLLIISLLLVACGTSSIEIVPETESKDISQNDESQFSDYADFVEVRKTVKTHTLNGRCRTVSGGEKTGEGIVL
jgi:major membrane immunogen (membrane-anchored lipoprotein)